MNSINRHKPNMTPAQPFASTGQMDALADLCGTAAQVGATGKQRTLVSALVMGIQATLLIGLAVGLAHKPAPIETKPIVVAIIEELQEREPPPPPPQVKLIMPQVEMNLPPPPQIYTPPPLVTVNAPPSPITATTTPPPPPSRVDPNIAIQQFQMRLLRQVNRNLRYPREARSDRLEGIVLIRFMMDRRGNVSNVSVHEPSAIDSLNQEGMAVLLRAQPFPPPPPELTGDPIDMILPVKFSLRGGGGPGGRHGGGGRGHHPHDDGEMDH